MTDPTGGLVVSALFSGGSRPGGAEIPEGAEDPVLFFWRCRTRLKL